MTSWFRRSAGSELIWLITGLVIGIAFLGVGTLGSSRTIEIPPSTPGLFGQRVWDAQWPLRTALVAAGSIALGLSLFLLARRAPLLPATKRPRVVWTLLHIGIPMVLVTSTALLFVLERFHSLPGLVQPA